jgi:hypothetical protein
MGFAAGGGRTPSGPATGVILSRDRARKASKKAGGGALRNAWQIRFTVKRELAYDLDMRKVVDHVRVAVMEHYRKSLKAGRTPGGRALPKTKTRTRTQFGGGTTYGLRSGYMADHWWSGKIRGGPFRCFVLVKPYGGTGGPTPASPGPGGRAFMIKNALKRTPPVDFQSVRGPARAVIQKAFDEAVTAGFGDVRTPSSVRVSEGLLPQLRGR